jgi:hypothetical protein
MMDPVPVAWVSRMRPPLPVSAPGYGATAHGKLWVSAVSRRSQVREWGASGPGSPGLTGSSGVTLQPAIADELSLNAITLLLGLALYGALTSEKSVSGMRAPAMEISPAKNQCLQCSLLLCAKSNSSTVVGLRFKSSLHTRAHVTHADARHVLHSVSAWHPAQCAQFACVPLECAASASKKIKLPDRLRTSSAWSTQRTHVCYRPARWRLPDGPH